MNTLLKNTLVLDIETVSASQAFQELTPSMQLFWTRKAELIRQSESQTVSELYESKSAIYAEFGRIIVIGMGYFAETTEGQLLLRTMYLAEDDENVLLKKFTTILERFDQKNLRLVAHNGREFDFPYLCRRYMVHHIPIPSTLEIADKKPWEIQHIDTLDLWKFGDKKNFTSLDLLTNLLDIPSPKTEMDGSKVSATYYNDKDGLLKIANYCLQDVVATAQLFLRFNYLPLIPPEHIIQVS